MSENKVMVEENTPKKVAFMSKPYTQEERLKKDEEELKQLIKQQKGETEEQKENKEQEEEKEENLNAEEKTFKKRYGDLRRHTQKKEAEFQKQLDELKKQLETATKKEIKLPKTDEDIETWAKEYPDIAAIVETIAIKKSNEKAKEIQEEIKRINEMNENTAKEKAEVELLRLHPDFEDIRDSEDFHEWADEQPSWVQKALYENDNDAKSAARAIDLYKSDKGINKQVKSTTDKNAATEVKTKSSRTKVDATEKGKKILESNVQKMSAVEYEKNADIIMEAIRSGNFIYDVSGSAR